MLKPGQKILRAADYQRWLESEDCLDAARREAEAIIAKAKDAFEAERLRGYAQGLAEARQEAAGRMLENIGLTIEYYGQVEQEMVDLVMEGVRKIAADFNGREKVLATVRNALAVVRNQKQVSLHCSLDAVPVLREQLNAILAEFPGVGFIDIVPDSRLNDDACILETEIGRVEASMDGQIKAMRKALAKIFGKRS